MNPMQGSFQSCMKSKENETYTPSNLLNPKHQNERNQKKQYLNKKAKNVTDEEPLDVFSNSVNPFHSPTYLANYSIWTCQHGVFFHYLLHTLNNHT